MKRMNVQSLIIEAVAVAAAVTRIEVAVRTVAVEMGTGTGVTKYPGPANYAW